MKLKIKYLDNYRLSDWGPVRYEKEGDSGFDLRAAINDTIMVPPILRSSPENNHIKLIPTGIKVELPIGTELQIRPRSGLALNNGITILNSPGTIDSGFRNEIGIIIINVSLDYFRIMPSMRIAQAVLSNVLKAEFEEVCVLGNSDRSEGGFGHTGSI